MKRAMRAAAWLYPKRWRKRYGDEFEALIEDAGAGWRSVADVLKGALKMQLSHWGSGRIVTVAAVVGVVIAAAASFSVPDQWQSQAVIRITPLRIPERAAQDSLNHALYDGIHSMEQAIESRSVLQTIINNFGLLPPGAQPRADRRRDRGNEEQNQDRPDHQQFDHLSPLNSRVPRDLLV